MTIRVLFADDQIPSQSDEDNEKTRREIVQVLSSKFPDADRMYEEDHRWFEGLLDYLSTVQGMKIIRAKTKAQAEAQVKQRDTFDVAVIDLTWIGDPSLKSDEKKTAGNELLELLSEENKRARDYKPVIAFSQNFEKNFELITTVLEKGALPIQKDYTELGHRMLGAAIKRVAMPLETRRRIAGGLPSDLGGLTLSQLLSELTVVQLWTAGTTMFGAAAGLASLAFWLGKTLGGHGQ
jgi:hypothetical protein